MADYPKIAQSKIARRMLHQGAIISEVIAALGGRFTEAQIQQGVIALRARERAYNGYDKSRSPVKLGLLPGAGRSKQVPRSLFAERMQRGAFQHTSIVARLSGDPAPERSALHSPSPPSTPRDPLKYLISPFRRRELRSAHVGEHAHD